MVVIKASITTLVLLSAKQERDDFRSCLGYMLLNHVLNQIHVISRMMCHHANSTNPISLDGRLQIH